MKTFKPQLAPNEKVDLSTLSYPLLASTKLDGIRCIFYKGEILSRSLKQIQNKQLREKFEPIRAWTEKTGNVIDGEIYDPSLSFQEIVSFVMTEDLTDPKTIKKNGGILEIPETLNYYAFDFLYGGQTNHSFFERLKALADVIIEIKSMCIHPVFHEVVNSEADVLKHFEWALNNNYEGLILRNPNSPYKCGRFTIKEGGAFKCKPFLTFDAKITGVEQSTEVNEDAEKKTNELGRSVTSKKIGDRHLIEKASAFWVDYEGKPLKVVLAMTDPEKVAVWANRDGLIGKTIEYKGMLVGSKDVPRHPVMIRFREDK